jgi:hypothetical protein
MALSSAEAPANSVKADAALLLSACVCGEAPSRLREGKHSDCTGTDFVQLIHPAQDRRSAAVHAGQCRLRQGMEMQVEPD